MGKLKTVELVLFAIAALVTAAKAIVKFVEYIDKFKKEKLKACGC